MVYVSLFRGGFSLPLPSLNQLGIPDTPWADGKEAIKKKKKTEAHRPETL